MKKYLRDLLYNWSISRQMFLLFILHFIFGIIPRKFIGYIIADVLRKFKKILEAKKWL
jgi:hypothetical protein